MTKKESPICSVKLKQNKTASRLDANTEQLKTDIKEYLLKEFEKCSNYRIDNDTKKQIYNKTKAYLKELKSLYLKRLYTNNSK